jgi:hypothetical protein
VLAYAALSAANQMLWLTFTPFTTDAAHHYGVSSGAIGWFAEIFPLVYVLLAVPAGTLIDRGLPFWLGTGAVLTAAGGLLRLAGDGYLPVLAGQLLVAVAQPLVLNAVTKVSGSYLRPADRASGIAVSSAGIFAGMLLALVTGAALGAHHLHVLLVLQAERCRCSRPARCAWHCAGRAGTPRRPRRRAGCARCGPTGTCAGCSAWSASASACSSR